LNQCSLFDSVAKLTIAFFPFSGSVPPIGSVFGSLAAGPLLAILGRKWTLALISIPYSIGFLLIGFATHPSVMIVGRIVKGFIIGVATPSAQIYVSFQSHILALLGEEACSQVQPLRGSN